MQFNRSALVAAIDTAIEQEREAISGADQRNKALDTEQRKEWISLHGEGWLKASNAIRAKLRRGDPVTEDDIPRDRSGYTGKAYYRPRRGESLPAPSVELAGLRAVLVAVADETITSASLRSLGVGVSTLRLIVPLLGNATVRSERLKVAP